MFNVTKSLYLKSQSVKTGISTMRVKATTILITYLIHDFELLIIQHINVTKILIIP